MEKMLLKLTFTMVMLTLKTDICDDDSKPRDIQLCVRAAIIIYAVVKLGVRGSRVVSVLDCQSRCPGFKSRPGQTFDSRFLLHLHHLANLAMTSTLTVGR